MSGQVHFEVFVRRGGAPWKLELATEERTHAVDTAEALFAEGKVSAVRVTKETLDPETREFKTVTILNKGAPEPVKAKQVREEDDPLCVTPQDLYTGHARDRIGRLLEGWLARYKVTPFELLHRPDLIEKLEASGTDLQHAVQKIAVPEAQARGISVHELIRGFQRLIEQAIERVLKDGRKGVLPDLSKESLAQVAARVMGDPDRFYLMGAAIAGAVAPAKGWSEKIGGLLDLVDAAPEAGPARGLAIGVVEQLLAEILATRVGLGELLGEDLDLGASLAAMARLAAADTVEALIAVEPSVAKVMPPLSPVAARLAAWLATDDFESVLGAIG
jgi:hypothetical protein